MKEKELKKVGKWILITYGVLALMIGAGAFQRLFSSEIFGIRGLYVYLAAAVLLFFALLLYVRRMERINRAGGRSIGLRFIATIYKYRFLIEQLVSRDFKIKYRRSVLGVFWSFLNPLLMMSVQYVVFSHLLNIRGDIRHYAIYLLSGIVMWNGFTDCTTQAMRSITGSAALITKVYVPKYIYPVTKVFSASINVFLSLIPLLLVTLVYGLFSKPKLFLTNAVLLLPFGLVFLIVFCIGMGFLLSSLMVFFRDIEFLWTVITAIWMYATPIIYSLSMFEDRAPWLVKLMQFNPLYHYIQFIRTIILEGASPALSEYGICMLFSLVMLAAGYAVFHKTQDKFILYL